MSDVLSQIKAKRDRATVEKREDALLKSNATTTNAVRPEIGYTHIEDLERELNKYPKVVRHSAIRLEVEIDARLTRFCKENGCTIETFLEAAFLFAETSNDARISILKNAQEHYDKRKKAGQLRKLITQLSTTDLASPTLK